MAPGTQLRSEIAGVTLTDPGLASGVFNALASAAVVAGRSSREVGRYTGELDLHPYTARSAMGLVAGLVQSALALLANLLQGTAGAGAVACLLTC